jgi:hypothetical protein
MKYNEEIWTDMTQDEKATYHLAEAFQKHTKDRGEVMQWIPSAEAKQCYNYERDGKYPADKIRESKHWPYFMETWEIFKDDENFNADMFIDAVFSRLRKGRRIFPAQLRTKTALANYKEYRMKMKMSKTISTEKKMMQDLASTYKFIRMRLGIDKLSETDLDYFFSHVKDKNILSDGIVCCIQQMLSPFYMVISKAFMKAYLNLDRDVQDEILGPGDYENLRILVKLKTPVYGFAKKVFGDDIL